MQAIHWYLCYSSLSKLILWIVCKFFHWSVVGTWQVFVYCKQYHVKEIWGVTSSFSSWCFLDLINTCVETIDCLITEECFDKPHTQYALLVVNTTIIVTITFSLHVGNFGIKVLLIWSFFKWYLKYAIGHFPIRYIQQHQGHSRTALLLCRNISTEEC